MAYRAYLLTWLLVGCTADVLHDGSNAVCSKKHGRGCQSSSLESAEDELARPLLQARMKLGGLDQEVQGVEKPEAVFMEQPQATFVEQPQATLVEVSLEESPSAGDGLSWGEPPADLIAKKGDLVLGEDMKSDCSDKLERFAALDNQPSWAAGNDPMFPPVYSSIAAAGVTCGDSAQGISNSCEEYNHWKTLQQVSEQIKKPFSIIGPSGITFDDISQGALGNCYFLAALASIANQAPQIIENMFVERELWSQNIFKTKWLVNGKETIMAVDNMIPADNDNTFFTHGSPTGEWWPVILAKTWAKIFGSFKAIEGGSAIDVITAITKSPFQYYRIAEKTEDETWQILDDAMRNKHPMNAGTGSVTSNGLAGGHAYAVLGVRNDPTYGKVVKCYNPWGKDNYVGAIPNTVEMNGPKPGVFTMKLTEFRNAFSTFSFNSVSTAYKENSISGIAAGRHVFELHVSQPGKFWVSLDYPSARMTDPCPTPDAGTSLKAQLTTDKGKVLGKELTPFTGMGVHLYEFEGTRAGTYLIVSDLKFSEESATYIDKFTINAYAPGDVTLRESSVPAADVEMEMYGPLDDNGESCSIIADPSTETYYVDKTRIVNGVPSYWTEDKQKFTYHWPSDKKWFVISASSWAKVSAGEGWSSSKVGKEDFTCGKPECGDRPGGITDFHPAIPCSKATDTNYLYSNVKCTGAQYSDLVQKTCPSSCFLCPGEEKPCEDAPDGISGFGEAIPCARATDTNYLYSNIKCTGAQYSNLVQEACPSSCFLCPGQKPPCEDAPGGVRGFGVTIPCDKATDTNYLYSNVKCTGAEHSATVQQDCKKTCGLCN